jgi:uncharacterized protein (TIGR03083 family)
VSKPHGNKESWLAALRAEGAAFHTAIETASTTGQLDSTVPTCPDWTVRELAFHLADVYRYVAGHVPRGEATKPERPAPEPTEGLDPLATFDQRYAEVVRVLESVDADLPAYNWAPQAKRAAFWHRRMAVETAVHRWDAQVASGPAEPVEAKLATDGINEVVDSMLPAGRRRGPVEGVRGVVALHAVDVGQDWYLRLRGQGIALLDTDTLLDDDHPHERAQATGTASDLLLALYGRVPYDVLEVAGDPRLLQALRTG